MVVVAFLVVVGCVGGGRRVLVVVKGGGGGRGFGVVVVVVVVVDRKTGRRIELSMFEEAGRSLILLLLEFVFVLHRNAWNACLHLS